MTRYDTRPLPDDPDAIAPDGSQVRVLLALDAGSMAHFRLEPGQVSRAVAHRTVEELWYVVAGRGAMWRDQDGRASVVELHRGTCLTLPLGTAFQFRADADDPLEAVGVTMPPWPGPDEAFEVPGPWEPTAAR